MFLGVRDVSRHKQFNMTTLTPRRIHVRISISAWFIGVEAVDIDTTLQQSPAHVMRREDRNGSPVMTDILRRATFAQQPVYLSKSINVERCHVRPHNT